MPVDKFSVSLPEDLVAEVDGIAAMDGLTRSAVIREATAAYVTQRKSAAYAKERRRRIDSALDGFEDIARAWGPDDRSGVDYLADVRGEDAEHG
ncbi:MAG: ribbon-helix-helix protein, CopG family [Coriobacteriia bacterium]